MTHFFTIALVPEGEDNMEEFIAGNLYRYDENLEVTPYIADCVCLGRRALDDANDAADRALGSIEEMAERFRITDGVSDVAQSPGYRRYLEGRKAYADRHAGNSVYRDEPDPGCEYCYGTGRCPSTYNPDSKFDYYEPGGRYDGCVLGRDAGSRPGSGDMSGNMIPAGEIDTDGCVFPIAIVLPDGTWVEKGTVGLFGHIQDEMPDPEWEGTVRDIYDRYGRCTAVGLDCHV